MKFGEYFKNRRMELGLTIRKFAAAKGYDIGYISRLENGLTPPPSDKNKVVALGEALELDKNSSKWSEFLDYVAMARSEVPVDLRDSELITKLLPAFYRSARNKKFDEDDVNKLIDLLEEVRKEE